MLRLTSHVGILQAASIAPRVFLVAAALTRMFLLSTLALGFVPSACIQDQSFVHFLLLHYAFPCISIDATAFPPDLQYVSDHSPETWHTRRNTGYNATGANSRWNLSLRTVACSNLEKQVLLYVLFCVPSSLAAESARLLFLQGKLRKKLERNGKIINTPFQDFVIFSRFLCMCVFHSAGCRREETRSRALRRIPLARSSCGSNQHDCRKASRMRRRLPSFFSTWSQQDSLLFFLFYVFIFARFARKT